MSGVSEQANGQAIGPVLTSGFLVDLAHCANVISRIDATHQSGDFKMRRRISIRGCVRWSVRPSVPSYFQTGTRRILCRVSGLVISSLPPFPHLSLPRLLLLISSPPYLFPRLPLPPLLPTPLPLLRLFSLSGGNNN